MLTNVLPIQAININIKDSRKMQYDNQHELAST